MNTDELEQAIYVAEHRVLEIQAKLHRWAVDDPHRRFGDLFNLVADPAFLLVAWDRVRGNKGAKTAGVDGHTAASIAARGIEEFLGALRDCLKHRSFCPLPSRERLIHSTASTSICPHSVCIRWPESSRLAIGLNVSSPTCSVTNVQPMPRCCNRSKTVDVKCSPAVGAATAPGRRP